MEVETNNITRDFAKRKGSFTQFPQTLLSSWLTRLAKLQKEKNTLKFLNESERGKAKSDKFQLVTQLDFPCHSYLDLSMDHLFHHSGNREI